MSTITKNRRHDDYRPDSLRTFWQWLYRQWWDFEDSMAKLYGYIVLGVLVVSGVSLLALSVYVLANLYWG